MDVSLYLAIESNRDGGDAGLGYWCPDIRAAGDLAGEGEHPGASGKSDRKTGGDLFQRASSCGSRRPSRADRDAVERRLGRDDALVD